MKKLGTIRIGTSGWIYKDWAPLFYPEGLPDRDKLVYLASHFPTVEVNSTFYHLARATTFENWRTKTPAGFIFAVKVSRYITHQLKLIDANEAWKRFITPALKLKEKLGPLLIQFPPSFKATEETIARMEKFLRIVQRRKSLRVACELRHASWFIPELFTLFKKYNISLVVADSSRYPKSTELTSDFVYVRFHGPAQLFSSGYTTNELKKAARQIKDWQTAGRDVFVYFNNDRDGHAIKDARKLRQLLGL